MCIEEVLTNDTVNYIDCKGDGVAFTLTVSNSTKFFRIRSLNGASRIGRISLAGSRSSGADFGVLIAHGVASFDDLFPENTLEAAGTHRGGLVYNETLSPLVRLAVAVSGNVPGTVEPPSGQTEIGNIHAGKIVRLQAGTPTSGGVISGEVKTWANLSLQSETSIDHVQINELADTAVIHATTGGRLIRLMCGYETAPGAGLLAGDIDVGMGRINAIEVYGPIGSSTDFAAIQAREGILSIIAYPNGDNEPQAVYANIDANTADQLYPPFSELRCGAFTGTLHAGTGDDANVSMPEIVIDGDLDGGIEFEGDLKIPVRIEGGCEPGSEINIRSSLWASVTADDDIQTLRVDGDVVGASGRPDVHLRSDSGRIESLLVGGDIASDDTDGQDFEVFIRSAGGFGTIEALGMAAFIGSSEDFDSLVPIDHLYSGLTQSPVGFDCTVRFSEFETFDVENPVDNQQNISHFINFGRVLAGARARFAGVATTPPGFDGVVRIFESDGLKGQLIFNADAVPNLDWSNFAGLVEIWDGSQFTPLTMPGYTESASTFGGGASGLVPFRLHGIDCVPSTWGTLTVCQGGFKNGSTKIELIFTGPVVFDEQNPVTMEMLGGDPPEWIPIDPAEFKVVRDQSDHRRVRVEALPTGFPWTPADYRIKPVRSGDETLRCDELFVTPGPAVSDFTYEFHVNGSCSGGACDETRCPCGGYCFFADFNQDGGVDGADVEAFYTVWETGEPAGDINLDGGTDGADLEAFYCLWELGGC